MKERQEIFEDVDQIEVPRPPHRQNTFRTIGRICFFAIALLIPFFFLPVTEDPVGINKLVLASLLSLVGLVCFLASVFEERKFEYPRSWFFFFLLLFMLAEAISAFFSIAPSESWYGSLGKPDSFLAIATYVVIFFLTTYFFRREDIRKVGMFLGAGLLIGSIISLLQIFGILHGANPVGSALEWGILMVAGVAALAGAHPRDLGPAQKKFFFAFAVVGGVVLFLLDYQFLWLAVAVFTVALAALRFEPKHQFRYAFVVIVAALFFTLIGPSLPKIVAVPADARPGIAATGAVAEGALQNWRVLVGTGPSTFSLDYSAFRPVTVNQTPSWNTIFDQGYDLILTVLATGGILGFILLLIVLGIVGEWFLQVQMFDTDRAMVLSMAMFLLVAFFFYPAFSAELIIFFLLLGLFVVDEPRREISFRALSRWASFSTSIVLMVLAAVALAGIYGEGEQYAGAILYGQAQALAAQNTDAALLKANQAINLAPSDEYLRGISKIFLTKAQQVVSTPELGPTVANAVQAAQGAVAYDQGDPANWGDLGLVYETVMPVASGADQLAEQSYQKAADLDPANPQWEFAIGRVFMEAADLLPAGASQSVARQADWTQAEAALEKALSLKNDYSDPRILLVQLYIKEGNIAQAIGRVQELKQQNPLDPGVAFELGYLYYESKQIDQAQEEFQVATILDPNYSNARYYLGLVYAQKGMMAQALSEFQAILVLNPENQQVQNIIASLEAGQSVPTGAASSSVTAAPPSVISLPAANGQKKK